MPTFHIDAITVPSDRQRRSRSAEESEALKASIESNGLLHPPVLRDHEGQIILVAGEGRLNAIRDLAFLGQAFRCGDETFSEGFFPALLMSDLSPLEAEELELEENIRREDLSWQDRSAAVAKLHALRLKQADQRAFETGINVPHTVADTAREVEGSAEGSFHDNTRKAIIVAKHLSNGEVAKAKTLDEAFKVLKRNETTKKNLALAESVGASWSFASHQVINGDAIGWMHGASGEQFDAIITDPPYGMGADSFGDGAGRLSNASHTYDDSYKEWQRLMGYFSYHSYRLAKPQAHLYICCDIDRFAELRDMMSDVGWSVHRTPLIIYKTDGNRVPWPEHGPRRQWEMILYAIKGKKPVNAILSDVIPTKLSEESYGHGAQKPVALFSNLLARSCRPGDRILDPFAGTGSCLVAAHASKVQCTAIELDPASYGIILKRGRELE